ncbi:MAG TPA: diguanylate cyclase, partial [Gemmatimonadales bacterium]|nr:diguanylate cyclase [Gemmatimonadales bacterium]
ALLLPETAEPEAWQVGQRISERLAADAETPPVQVSLGLATYPRDGADPESLLGMADTRLYQARSRSRGEAPFPGAPGVR